MSKVSGYKADRDYYYWQMEGIATNLRLGMAPDVPLFEALPGAHLYDALDKEIVKAGGRDVVLRTDTRVLPAGTLGETSFDRINDRLMLVLSEETYLGLERDEGRARFSFFHEVGHIALHSDLLLRLGQIHRAEAALQRASADPYPRYSDTEFQANYMAAALLMPAAALEHLSQGSSQILFASEVADRFKVSREAAELRLRNFYEKRPQLLRAVRHHVGR